MEPLYATAPCGLGFAVMESFMDKLTVKSTVEKEYCSDHEKSWGRLQMNKPLPEENLGLVHLCANRFRGRV